MCGGDSTGVLLNGKNGKDGKNGTNGISCTMETIDGGYKVLCGGDSIGVLLNGKDGKDGQDGQDGNSSSGKDGNSCWLNDNGLGTVTISCKTDAGNTNAQVFKALCGGIPYDPTNNQVCFENKVYGTFSDSRDGKKYRKTFIGSLTWMAENLNYEDRDGYVESFCYNNKEENCKKYGRLYTASDLSEICPKGWHMPDSAEWAYLFNNVGGIENSIPKLLANTYPETDKDLFGFSILPAGVKKDNGNCYLDESLHTACEYSLGFSSLGNAARFWTKTASSYEADSQQWYKIIEFDIGYKTPTWEDGRTDYANSVRCVENDDIRPLVLNEDPITPLTP